MPRSTSPGPSIAPSVTSTAPSAWLDLHPLARDLPKADRYSENSGVGTHYSLDDDDLRPYDDGVVGINANWSLPSKTASIQIEDGRGLKKGRTSMFSRVFKSGDVGTSFLPMSTTRARSESMDHLNPQEATDPHFGAGTPSSSRQYVRSASLSKASDASHRKGSSGKEGSPRSHMKNNKGRRPKSLNIVASGGKRTALPLPPTVNTLPPEARADLLRKNRKLQKMLGTEFSHVPTPTHRSAKSMDSGHGSGDLDLPSSDFPGGLSQRNASSFGSAYSESKASASVLSMGEVLTSPDSRKKGTASRSSAYRYASGNVGDRFRALGSVPPLPETPNSFMDLSDSSETTAHATSRAKTPEASAEQDPFDSPGRESTWAMTINVPLSSKNEPIFDSDGSDSENGDRSKTPRPPAKEVLGSTQNRATSTTVDNEPYRLSLASPRPASTPPISPSLHRFPTGSHLHPYAHGGRSHSVESVATFLTATSASMVDEEATERKRRRDRLVKLHRYLGSNVPAGLVFGVETGTATDDLPESSTSQEKEGDETAGAKWWRNRQMLNSSIADAEDQSLQKHTGPDSQMAEQDRVLNVKRKTKMERMFGHTPPQELFVVKAGADSEQLSTAAHSIASGEASDTGNSRRGRARDSVALKSLEFLRHSHSLDSLNHLVDKDDRESLRNLFDELVKVENAEEIEEEIVFAPPEDDSDEDLGIPPRHLPRSSLHSLSPLLRSPPRMVPASPSSSSVQAASVSPSKGRMTVHQLHQEAFDPIAGLHRRTSGSSLFSMNLEAAPMDPFQQRRKRAAKLTKFFGTDYRSIFGEVLESIEVDVMDDQVRGTLTDAEAAELLRKVRKLRVKQTLATFSGSLK